MAGTEIASAYVALLPSFRGGRADIDRELGGPVRAAGENGGRGYGEGMSRGIGSIGKKIFAPLAAIAIGGGVVSFFKDAVNGASDLNESSTKIEAIFGKATGAVNKFASGGAKALGQTQLDVLNATATFGTFGKAAGLTGPDLAKFSTGLTGLSTDLASFYNTDPAQATEAIGAALRGEAEPIRSYGVLLDDATLKAEAMSLGLVKTAKNADAIKAAQLRATVAQRNYNAAVKEHGKDSKEALSAQAGLTTASAALKKATDGTIQPLTQQQKVLAAQSAIYKQTKDAQGDFQKTSGGLANQQRILSAQFSDFKTNLGKQLLPVIVQVVTVFNNKVLPALSGVGTYISTTVVPALKSFGQWIVKNKDWLLVAGTAIVAFLAVMKTASVIQTFTTALRAMRTAGLAATLQQWGLNAAVLANPMVLIIAGVVALVAALVVFFTRTETGRKIITAAWAGIKTAIKAVSDWFTQTALPALKKAFDVLWTFLKTMWKWSPLGIVVSNWGKIKSALGSALSGIKSFFSSAWDFMKKVFSWTPVGIVVTHWSAIRDKFSGYITSIKGFFESVWSKMKTVFGYSPLGLVTKNFGAIVSYLKGLPGKFTSALSGLWSGVGSGFKSSINAVIGAWNGLSFTIPSVKAFGKTIGGGTISTPNIPYLASGGIVTRPTLAMVGEGRESEAVLPLSKLEALINGGASKGARGMQVIVQGDVVDPYAMARKIQQDAADALVIAGLRGSGS